MAISAMGLSQYTRKVWLEFMEQKSAAAGQNLNLVAKWSDAIDKKSDVIDKKSGCIETEKLPNFGSGNGIPPQTPRRNPTTSPAPQPPAATPVVNVPNPGPNPVDPVPSPTPVSPNPVPPNPALVSQDGGILLGLGLGIGLSAAVASRDHMDRFLFKMTGLAFSAKNKALVLIRKINVADESEKANLVKQLEAIDKAKLQKALDYVNTFSEPEKTKFNQILTAAIDKAPINSSSLSFKDYTIVPLQTAARHFYTAIGSPSKTTTAIAAAALTSVILVAVGAATSAQKLDSSQVETFLANLATLGKSIGEKMDLYYKKVNL